MYEIVLNGYGFELSKTADAFDFLLSGYHCTDCARHTVVPPLSVSSPCGFMCAGAPGKEEKFPCVAEQFICPRIVWIKIS